MGLTKRKSIEQPAEKSTQDRLTAARAEIADLDARITAAEQEHDLALINDDPAAVNRAETAAAALKNDRVRARRRVVLLEEKLAAEQRAEQERVQAELLAHATAKLDERDAGVAEMCDGLDRTFAAYRKVLTANAAVSAAYPWDHGDVLAAILGRGAFFDALAGEIYRQTGSEMGKGSFEFPGGQCPTPFSNRRPSSIKPLIEQIRAASDYALRRMQESQMRLLPLPQPQTVHPQSIAPASPQEAPDDSHKAVEPAVDNRSPEFAWFATYIKPGSSDQVTERIVFGIDQIRDSEQDGVGPGGKLGRSIALRLAEQRIPEGYVIQPESLAFDLAALTRSIGG